ncbi:MAG: class I SAM-dependent methyltransferase [Bacillota bacterium]|nr:class I SAM-dependent methyltransferase [Bacillota bacterium]
MIKFRQIAELAHHLAGMAINEGDTVVDATAGNGIDTLFLAEKVGPEGKVFAFDIQEEALQKTAENLKNRKLSERVLLIHDSHENIAEYINIRISVVIYNLGYLPGGNKQITTRCTTTIHSLKEVLKLLAPGGIIVITAYRGHAEGKIELDKIMQMGKSLLPAEYTVLHLNLLNQENEPPELIVIQKSLFYD